MTTSNGADGPFDRDYRRTTFERLMPQAMKEKALEQNITAANPHVSDDALVTVYQNLYTIEVTKKRSAPTQFNRGGGRFRSNSYGNRGYGTNPYGGRAYNPYPPRSPYRSPDGRFGGRGYGYSGRGRGGRFQSRGGRGGGRFGHNPARANAYFTQEDETSPTEASPRHFISSGP